MKQYDVLILGSGFAGLTVAIHLNKAGISNYALLEREEKPGGTWQVNHYPGAAVDVLSSLYSLSFEPYPWTERYAKQAEILAYTNHIIDKHSLRDKCETQADIENITFDEEKNRWHVRTRDGREYSAKAVVNSVGHLSQPSIPHIKGADTFAGKSFHTARWDHNYSLDGKRVAVIGTGASSIQVVPAIADHVGQLHVMQRSPHWIIPRHDRPLNRFERFCQSVTPLRLLNRAWVYSINELRVLGLQYFPSAMRLFSNGVAMKHLRAQVPDNNLRKQLIPSYVIGCKRILISDDYYPALQKPNVVLETAGIDHINERGIVDSDGKQIELDLIVYATGFHAFSNRQCVPFDVVGREGRTLMDYWNDTAQAYAGTTVPYFPNLFFTNGPNTSIGHTSAIYMAESQMGYIINAVKQLITKSNVARIEIKEEAYNEYNKAIHAASKKSVWETGNCSSWYQNQSGINTGVYPGFSFNFRRAANHYDPDKHLVSST